MKLFRIKFPVVYFPSKHLKIKGHIMLIFLKIKGLYGNFSSPEPHYGKFSSPEQSAYFYALVMLASRRSRVEAILETKVFMGLLLCKLHSPINL